jgi:hypothetical protein
MGPSAPDDGEKLASWKEIAAFLGKDVRTVRRWNAERGLPVYRVPGGKRSSVFAYRSELEAWLRGSSPGKKEREAVRNPSAAMSPAPRISALPRLLSAGMRRTNSPLRPGIYLALALVVLAGLFLNEWPRPARSKQAPQPIVLAVLPFADLSRNPKQEYFSDGLTEELICELGRLNPRRLEAIAPTSAFAYKAPAANRSGARREVFD